MYPDYATDDFGETWLDSVEAENPVDAVLVARSKCASDNEQLQMDPVDLRPVCVIEGIHNDLVGEFFASMWGWKGGAK